MSKMKEKGNDDVIIRRHSNHQIKQSSKPNSSNAVPIETSIRTKRIAGDHQIQRGSLSSAEEEKKYSKSNNPYYINTAVSTTTGKIDMKKYQESMIGSNEIISNKTNTPLGKVINGG